MHGLKRHRSGQNDATRLQLTTAASHSTTPAISESESAQTRIRRTISEHPVVIYASPACYMCRVMKNLLSAIGAHPTVIELDQQDKVKAKSLLECDMPVVYVGRERVGGLEALVGMHLSGRLVPKLVEAGAL